MDLSKLNRRTLEALIRSGSMDGFGANRATLTSRLPAAMLLGDQSSRAVEAGQSDLFGLGSGHARAGALAPSPGELPDWSEQVRLAGERETLGLYLTGHPIERFEADLPRFISARIGELVSERPSGSPESGRGFTAGRPATVAGLVDEVRKRGPRVSLVLDDRSGRLEVTLFDEVYQQFRDLIAKDALVLIEGSLRFDEFSDGWRLSARRITDLYKAREQQAQRLLLRWPAALEAGALIERLAHVLDPWRKGNCAVSVQYRAAGASCALRLGPEWSVRPTRELVEQLEGFFGRDGVKLIYGPPASVPSFGASGQ
jgi:DNA polymerase III subunit alpha